MITNINNLNKPLVGLKAILLKACLLVLIAGVLGLVLGKGALFQVGYFSELSNVFGAPLVIGFQLILFFLVSRFIPYWYAYPIPAWAVSNSVLEGLGLDNSDISNRIVAIFVYATAYLVIFCIITFIRFFAPYENYTTAARVGVIVLLVLPLWLIPGIAKALENKVAKDRVTREMILYPSAEGIKPYTYTEHERDRKWTLICYTKFVDDRGGLVCDGLDIKHKGNTPCDQALESGNYAVADKKILPYTNMTSPNGKQYGEAIFNMSAYVSPTTTSKYKNHKYCFYDDNHEYTISRSGHNDIHLKAHEQIPIQTVLDSLVLIPQATR